MEILNLYSGIGGNRKLWEGHAVTAVEYRQDIADVYKHFFPGDTVIVEDAHEYLLNNYERFDFIWDSRPCQTHSRAKFWATGAGKKYRMPYPDMGLYQEIIYLKYFFKGKWVVENVKPYYEPLVIPGVIPMDLDRHLFWSNFTITKTETKKTNVNRGTRDEWKAHHGFDLSPFKFQSRTDQIYRNCVHPETGLHILNCALGKSFNKKDHEQQSLFGAIQ